MRCEACGSYVDLEDLFCGNCGRESPHPPSGKLEFIELTAVNFRCRGCGASMNYDAGAASLRCPFCGAAELEKSAGHRVIRPDRVVRAALDRGAVTKRFRDWCSGSFWRPADLGREARLTEIAQVYLPFWVFRAGAETCWCADSSRLPAGARGDWMPLFGEVTATVEGVLVPAGSGVPGTDILAVAEFDLAAGIEPEEVDLENVTVEQFAVSRKYARTGAHQGIERLFAERCAAQVPGRARNLRVNVLLREVEARPVLLPFWILAYRYGDRVYRFVANAQTGATSGSAPVSVAKIVLVAGLVLVLTAAIALLAIGVG